MAKPRNDESAPAPKHLSALQRAIDQAIGEDRRIGADDDPARTKYPALWEWLSSVYVGRDHIRRPATLTLQLGPEGVLATLTDRDLSVSLTTGCRHLDGIMQAVEDALTGPNPPVRSWGNKEPKLRKRRSSS